MGRLDKNDSMINNYSWVSKSYRTCFFFFIYWGSNMEFFSNLPKEWGKKKIFKVQSGCYEMLNEFNITITSFILWKGIISHPSYHLSKIKTSKNDVCWEFDQKKDIIMICASWHLLIIIIYIIYHAKINFTDKILSRKSYNRSW